MADPLVACIERSGNLGWVQEGRVLREQGIRCRSHQSSCCREPGAFYQLVRPLPLK
jgi:hypothetical protein